MINTANIKQHLEVTTHIAMIQPTQPKAKPFTQNVLIPQFIWRCRGMVCIAEREPNSAQVAAGHLDTSVQSDGVYDHEAIITEHPCAQWGQGRPEIHLGGGVGSGQNLQLQRIGLHASFLDPPLPRKNGRSKNIGHTAQKMSDIGPNICAPGKISALRTPKVRNVGTLKTSENHRPKKQDCMICGGLRVLAGALPKRSKQYMI